MAKWWLRLLSSILLLVQIHGCRGCHVRERMSLLQFKEYLKSNVYDVDDHDLLPSWVEDPESDCCLWDRVTCDNITRHVIHLSLGSFIGWRSRVTRLNISIFQPFKEMRILNLSYNGINGWIEEEVMGHGGGMLLRLQQLETLDLSYNYFHNHTSIHSLGALTSLKTLNLSKNKLDGSLFARELSVLENLESLDLSFNSIGGSLTMQDLQYLSKLSKLEHLDLTWNGFNKDIIRSLGSLPSLKSLNLGWNLLQGSLSDEDFKIIPRLEMLDLSGNFLVGNIPSKMWEQTSLRAISLAFNQLNGSLSIPDFMTIPRLEMLDLSGNDLVGNIPSKMWELTSLRAISLAGNQLNGSLSIPGICELNRLEELDLADNSLQGILPSCLNNMTSLRYVDLRGNQFDGSFNFSSLANLSKLEIFVLACDGNKLKTDADYFDQIPLFQLKVLSLSNCSLESIPKFLHHQHRLRAIDLSHNKLNGTFPTWLAENNTELEFLDLGGNLFSGKLHLPTNISMRNIHWVDISSNQFNGQLQDDFGNIFSNAQYINMSNNHFEGNLPHSISVIGELWGLDLSNNSFSGEVPKEIFKYCTHLWLLWLSNNKFQGEIFSSYFNLRELQHLKLNDNQFTGSLSLSNISWTSDWFNDLDVSNNKFTGEIPSWIFNYESIGILALRNNSFEGQFPCKERTLKVDYLDISFNSLSGPLPYCFEEDSLEQLHVEGNHFSGSIPSPLFSNFSALKVLNLKQNRLVGSIPSSINEIENLPSLRILLLRDNLLNGSIPEMFCRFKDISIMDLSNNNFSGQVPQCFYNISWGKVDTSSNYESLAQDIFPGRPAYVPFYELEASLLRNTGSLGNAYGNLMLLVEIDIVTKNRQNLYRGSTLDLMSGLDLSCNYLIGEIPSGFGNMSSIHALNLSHNRLAGTIPVSFSKLAQVESLDLSYNHLSGVIPSELGNLNFLQVFSVAHNDLSGEIPQATQFSTFNESSFEGNPLLCGMPLKRNCNMPPPPHPPIAPLQETEGKWFEVDPIAFYASSASTYVVVLLAFVTVLYINPYWRSRWFFFIENFLDSSYYFVYYALHKLWS